MVPADSAGGPSAVFLVLLRGTIKISSGYLGVFCRSTSGIPLRVCSGSITSTISGGRAMRR